MMVDEKKLKRWAQKTLSTYWARRGEGLFTMTPAEKRAVEKRIVEIVLAQEGVCPETGITYAWDNAKKAYNSPAIVRLNPTVGYRLENVTVSSQIWNRFKGELFTGDARRLIREIVRHLNGN
jgi:hypothetical protein